MRVFVDSKGMGLEMDSARVSGCTRLTCALRRLATHAVSNELSSVAATVKYMECLI